MLSWEIEDLLSILYRYELIISFFYDIFYILLYSSRLF